MAEIAKPCSTSAFRPASLDAANFLLADVRGALGPYLNVFLVTQQHWSQSAVGLVTTLDGLLASRSADADRGSNRFDPGEARHDRGGARCDRHQRRHHRRRTELLACLDGE